MKTLVGKFTFAVPEGHAEAGKKIEKAFEYQECENDTEAQSVLAEKNLSLAELVNDKLKANARSNSYQAALLPYRPTEKDPAEIVERMVRDYIRLGVAEDVARKMVAGVLEATKTAETTA